MTALERQVRRLIRLSIGLYIVVALLVGAVWVGYMRQQNADRRGAHALCTQIEQLKSARREEISQQLGQSRQYLVDHPHGTKDFPRSLILQAIRNDQKNLARFAPTECR